MGRRPWCEVITVQDGDEIAVLDDLLMHADPDWSGPTLDGVAACVCYLSMWDMGDESEHEASVFDEIDGVGSDVYEYGGYVLTVGRGYDMYSLWREVGDAYANRRGLV